MGRPPKNYLEKRMSIETWPEPYIWTVPKLGWLCYTRERKHIARRNMATKEDPIE